MRARWDGDTKIMTIGVDTIKKEKCYACTRTIGEHSNKDLIRCFFRVQGTLIVNAKELWEYKEMEADQMKQLDKKQLDQLKDDRGNDIEWKQVDVRDPHRKKTLADSKELDKAMGDLTEEQLKELSTSGTTQNVEQLADGGEKVMEFIDPNSEEGKKIMKLHAEQFKNQRKPKKGVQVNEVDMRRNKDGKN
jgi:hypothetical protein